MSRSRIAVVVAVAAAILTLLLVSAVDAHAKELVRFVDGRYLEVERHQVHGKIVRLTLEPGAIVVFSAARVEWIERAGLRVFEPTPVSSALATQRVPEGAGDPSPTSDRDAAAKPAVREIARDFAVRPARGRAPAR